MVAQIHHSADGRTCGSNSNDIRHSIRVRMRKRASMLVRVQSATSGACNLRIDPPWIDIAMAAALIHMRVSVSQDRWRRAILLCLPLAFAIVVATYSWRVNTQLADDYAQITRSYAITAGIVAVMGRVTDGETGERGFVITGNDAYLQPYALFMSTIEALYANLVALPAIDPVQTAQIVSLRALLDQRKEELARIIRL